jgi:hypothetical protein
VDNGSTTVHYAPLIDLLNSCFGLSEDDGDEAKVGKIETLVSQLMPGQEAEFVPFLATMLGVPLSGKYADYGQRVRYLEPMALRGRIFHAVPAFLEALAGRGPLVLMFEDLH